MTHTCCGDALRALECLGLVLVAFFGDREASSGSRLLLLWALYVVEPPELVATSSTARPFDQLPRWHLQAARVQNEASHYCLNSKGNLRTRTSATRLLAQKSSSFVDRARLDALSAASCDHGLCPCRS